MPNVGQSAMTTPGIAVPVALRLLGQLDQRLRTVEEPGLACGRDGGAVAIDAEGISFVLVTGGGRQRGCRAAVVGREE